MLTCYLTLTPERDTGLPRVDLVILFGILEPELPYTVQFICPYSIVPSLNFKSALTIWWHVSSLLKSLYKVATNCHLEPVASRGRLLFLKSNFVMSNPGTLSRPGPSTIASLAPIEVPNDLLSGTKGLRGIYLHLLAGNKLTKPIPHS
jgi:hypothetical protein